MSIYTKRGDDGDTSLPNERMTKFHPKVEALGAIDELNAHIGFARSLCSEPHLHARLEQIQQELFDVGTIVAMESNEPHEGLHEATKEMERLIDQWTEELPPLQQFILPSGTSLSASLHIARTICRRAEREVVRAHQTTALSFHMRQYMNRLSDFLFLFARKVNALAGQKEETYVRGSDVFQTKKRKSRKE